MIALAITASLAASAGLVVGAWLASRKSTRDDLLQVSHHADATVVTLPDGTPIVSTADRPPLMALCPAVVRAGDRVRIETRVYRGGP